MSGATRSPAASTEWMGPLSAQDERLLLRESSLVEFACGEPIFAPTRRPQSVYLLDRGLVRVYRLGEAGSEVTLGYVRVGEVFGELTAFGDHPRESFAVAALPSTVRRFTRSGFERLVLGDVARVTEVTRQIAERLKRAESRIEHLVFDDVHSRLVAILLELARDFGERHGEGVRLTIRLSQSDLATLIGATRQTVNTVLMGLRNEGLVSQEGGLLVLAPQAALRRSLAGAGPSGRGGPRPAPSV